MRIDCQMYYKHSYSLSIKYSINDIGTLKKVHTHIIRFQDREKITNHNNKNNTTRKKSLLVSLSFDISFGKHCGKHGLRNSSHEGRGISIIAIHIGRS